MTDIKERINSLTELDTLTIENIFEDIEAMSTEEEKKELYDAFIKKSKETLITSSLEEEAIHDKLEEITNKMLGSSLGEETIRDILNENKFEEEEILNEIQQAQTKAPVEEKEIDKINARIAELEAEIGEKSIEELDEEVKKLETEKSSKIKELNQLEEDRIKHWNSYAISLENLLNPLANIPEKELDKIQSPIKTLNEELENLNKEYEELRKKIELAELNPEDCMYPEFEQDKKRVTELENQIQKGNKELAELETKLQNLFNEELTKTLNKKQKYNELEKVLDNLNKEYEELRKKIELAELNPEDCMYPEFEQDKKRVTELENQIQKTNKELAELKNLIGNLNENKFVKLREEYDELKKKIELAELNPEDCMYPEFEQDKKRLSELEKQLQEMNEKIVKLYPEYDELKKKIELAELNPEDCMYPEFEQDKKRLSELKSQLQELLDEDLAKIREERKEIQSTYDKKVENIQELKRLRAIKEAYNKIMNDALENFKDEKEVSQEEVNDFVNSHEALPTLDIYPNAEKLKQELKEDIYNNLKKKKVEKKEQNKKLLYKALAGASGFVLGLGFSAAPGVGTIRMVAATTKLVSSAVNKAVKVWTNKHPEGKVAKIVNATREKMNDLNEKANEKFPKIMETVRKAREIIEKHKEEINWFVNGFSAGYITGNIIEMVTGKSIWEHLTEKPEIEPTIDTVPEKTPTPDQNPTRVENTVEPINPEKPTPKPVQEVIEPVIPDINPSDITLNPGDVIDVSQLEYGLVSPDATNAVHLMNEVGKQVEVDKFVQIGEKTMVHLKQMNGLGYAWFDLADVQEVVANAAEVTKGMKM